MMISHVRVLVFGALAMLTMQAQALVLTPDSCVVGDNCWVADVTGMPNTSEINALIGTTGLNMAYKAEVDGGLEEGFFAGSYETAFANSTTDPMDAFIRHIGPELIGCDECYVAIKDGNSSPNFYVFDISGWDGSETIEILNFWPNQGAISNVSIWTTASVPGPATLGMLGMGLIMMAFARRRA